MGFHINVSRLILSLSERVFDFAFQRKVRLLSRQCCFKYHGNMEGFRLPRFNRVSHVAVFEITDRDRVIINLVRQHRFLRSSHIISLISGSSQQILRRLKLLFHHGYLERPRAQLHYYHKGGSREIVYGLGNRGAPLINDRPLAVYDKWGEKNRSIGRVFLEHALLVSDVMIALELACRASPNVRLISEHMLNKDLEKNRKRTGFRWKVTLPNGPKLGVVPDRVFALEFSDQSGNLERAYFFLEADRGTMPVMRKTLSQTSFFRKLLAYEATWVQSIHSKRLGVHRFRMLTVTTNEARLKSLKQACLKLQRGHGLFLFTDRQAIKNVKDILSPIWTTADDKTAGLLN